MIDNMVAIHKKRWFKYVRKVVLDFQDFIQFLFFNVSESAALVVRVGRLFCDPLLRLPVYRRRTLSLTSTSRRR